MTTIAKQSLLSEPVLHEIDRWLEKYPPDRKQSAVLIALRLAQKQNGGWLTEDLMNAVADYLQLPPIAVYEVATFYSMYNLKPVGKHKVAVCTSISCMLRGADKIVKNLQQRFGNVPLGEPSPDGCFFLQKAECLAACRGAPVMQIDDEEYYEDLNLETANAILDEIEALEREPADGK